MKIQDSIEIMTRYDGAYTYRLDGVFIVDDIPYDWVWAENEIRPMIQLIDDDDDAGPPSFARWNPTPVTEDEMRKFIRTGILDGKRHA